MSIPLRLLLDPAYALPVKSTKREGMDGPACRVCGERMDSIAGMYPDYCKRQDCPYGNTAQSEGAP